MQGGWEWKNKAKGSFGPKMWNIGTTKKAQVSKNGESKKDSALKNQRKRKLIK